MSFTLFKRSRGTGEPFISVIADGFRISAAFIAENHLEKSTGVRLYFDGVKRCVGFEFVPAGKRPRDGWLALRQHDGGFVVHGKSFFAAHNIDAEGSGGRYTPEVAKTAGAKTLFTIRLRKPSEPPASGSRHSRR